MTYADKRSLCEAIRMAVDPEAREFSFYKKKIEIEPRITSLENCVHRKYVWLDIATECISKTLRADQVIINISQHSPVKNELISYQMHDALREDFKCIAVQLFSYYKM